MERKKDDGWSGGGGSHSNGIGSGSKIVVGLDNVLCATCYDFLRTFTLLNNPMSYIQLLYPF